MMQETLSYKKKLVVPKEILDRQAESGNPQFNIWVSANAGSGKTHVLTQRVIRLLLIGTDPARILCLTYTKAAAALMRTRIFERLSEWTRLDDLDLRNILSELEGKRVDKNHLQTARRLFARALETPGGLKIQTIHAFCESILHQFPLEANITGHFELIDDVQQNALFTMAKQWVLEKIWQSSSDTALKQAFECIFPKAGEDGLEKLFNAAIANRHILQHGIKNAQQSKDFFLHEIFQLNPDENELVLFQKLKETVLFPEKDLKIFKEQGGKNARAFVEIQIKLSKTEDKDLFIKFVKDSYLKKNSVESRSLRKLLVQKIIAVAPECPRIFLEKQKNIQILLDKLKKVDLIRFNMAAYEIIKALLERYIQIKRMRGLMDFEDLITGTLALLKRKGVGQWVQYKLDRGIDHILLDEAQDTSSAQWEIVQLLSEEFFSGHGQRDITTRTIFAVGDEKQSIYSFQGAVPEDFARNAFFFERKTKNAQKSFKQVRLDFSFRSSRNILSAIDTVFSKPENYDGLSAENVPTVHKAVRVDVPGAVEIWQFIIPEDKEEQEDWRRPVNCLAAPAIRLAEKIAETIATWLKQGELLASKERFMQERDIMILVRKRKQFVHALSRALKNRKVAVAGSDRLFLTEHIAVRDLMALGYFVLQPQDDLCLAGVLKSPLFGITEEQLFSLAANRRGTLWESLQEKACDLNFLFVVEELRQYRVLADIIPVFEFYSRVLSTNGGRKKILARLGAESGDILDAFLDYALSTQKTGLPGLQFFLGRLEEEKPEIKREMDQERNEIRIMTVHASKGLEAPVVFLVDPGSAIWNNDYEPELLPFFYKNKKVLVWYPNKEFKTIQASSIIETLKKRAEQEYRRLLYVGMTRAKDKLIVCGYRGKQKIENSWLSLISHALLDKSEKVSPSTSGVDIWRFCAGAGKQQQKTMIRETKAALDVADIPPLPRFLKTRAPIERRPLPPLVPSEMTMIDPKTVLKGECITDSPILENKKSFTVLDRGKIIHRLFQYLPDLEKEKQRELAFQYLIRFLPGNSPKQLEKILERVFSVLDNPRIQPLFSRNSKSEVALAGEIEIGGIRRNVSGQIDRLAVFESHVLLVDFKTGIPPQTVDKIPDAYLFQIGLYVHLLKQVYQNKDIHPLLVYTQKPVFFELDGKKIQKLSENLHKNTL